MITNYEKQILIINIKKKKIAIYIKCLSMKNKIF